MLLTLTPPASIELATVADAEARLPDADPGMLTALVTRASAAIATACGRPFGLATYQERFGHWHGRTLPLSRYPLVAVTSITIGDTVLDPATDWAIDSDDGAIVRLTQQRDWPMSPLDYMYERRMDRPLTAVYQAGYVLPNDGGAVTLPADLTEACLQTVDVWYARIGSDQDLSSVSVDTVRLMYNRLGGRPGLPASVTELIAGYTEMRSFV